MTTNTRWMLRAVVCGAFGFPLADDTGDQEETDRCPCALESGRVDVPGNAIGGPGGKVSVTGLTWSESQTELEITTHQGKTDLELILAVIPKVSASYEFTIAHQTQFKRTNIRRKVIVEYTDFTEEATPGRCYSYVEEPICENRTERGCHASLTCKVKLLNGRGNKTLLDVGVYRSSKPNVPADPSAIDQGRIIRLPNPGGPPVPLVLTHDLACGDSRIENVTSGQWSLVGREPKLHSDFAFSSSCGKCPTEVSDEEKRP